MSNYKLDINQEFPDTGEIRRIIMSRTLFSNYVTTNFQRPRQKTVGTTVCGQVYRILSTDTPLPSAQSIPSSSSSSLMVVCSANRYSRTSSSIAVVVLTTLSTLLADACCCSTGGIVWVLVVGFSDGRGVGGGNNSCNRTISISSASLVNIERLRSAPSNCTTSSPLFAFLIGSCVSLR